MIREKSLSGVIRLYKKQTIGKSLKQKIRKNGQMYRLPFTLDRIICQFGLKQ